MMDCPVCGKRFNPRSGRHRPKKYCSAECRKRARYSLRKPKQSTCKLCRRSVLQPHIGRLRKYCETCANNRGMRYVKLDSTCALCGGPCLKTSFRCRTCVRKYGPHSNSTQIFWCLNCGSASVKRNHRGNKHCCSRECGFEYQKGRPKLSGKTQSLNPKYVGSTDIGRALRNKCEIQPFKKREVLVRDRFRCVKCGHFVFRGRNHDRQATVDHAVPLSRGGNHEISNCQTLCRKCNTEKRDRTNLEWVFEGWLEDVHGKACINTSLKERIDQGATTAAASQA